MIVLPALSDGSAVENSCQSWFYIISGLPLLPALFNRPEMGYQQVFK
jgi:hypothetical protein